MLNASKKTCNRRTLSSFSVAFLCPKANARLIPKFLVVLLLPLPPSRRCQFPVSGSPPTLSKYCPVAPLRLPHPVSGSPPTLSKYCPVAPLRLPHPVQLISSSFVPQSTLRHFPTPTVPLPEERAGTAREQSVLLSLHVGS